MRNITLIPLIIGLFLQLVPAMGYGAGQGPRLQFIKESENIGRVLADDPILIQLSIEFTNSGDQPLIISNVRGCCGTRILEFSKNPILPGQKGTIKVDLNVLPGTYAIDRAVNVLSNDPEGMKIFHIFGDVIGR